VRGGLGLPDQRYVVETVIMALSRATLALRAVDRVMRHGDDKHGKNEWSNHAGSTERRERHVAALRRHLERFLNGEVTDESGQPALAHVATRALMALEFDERLRRGETCLDLLESDTPLSRVCCLSPGHFGSHYDDTTGLHWGNK